MVSMDAQAPQADTGELPFPAREDGSMRSFSSYGYVVTRGGRVEVIVGGALIAAYDKGDTAMRDVVVAGLAQGPRARLDLLASSFGMSIETLRKVRGTYREGGMEALLERPRRGQPRKLTPRLRAKILRSFDDQASVTEAHEEVAAKVSRSTVGALRREWGAAKAELERQAELRGSLDPQPALATEPEVIVEGLPLFPEAGGESAATTVLDDDETISQVEAVRSPTDEAEPPAAPVPAAAIDPPAEGGPTTEGRIRTLDPASGRWVQHLGGWLLIAMLNRFGLYERLEQVRTRHSSGALRVALDALVLALAIGERTVEGVRRLATPSSRLLLRSNSAPSATWVRQLLGSAAASGGGERVHFDMAVEYVRVNAAAVEAGPEVFYIDNHLRPYTGQEVLRRGWRMQDKAARPGTTDYYVHDIDGRPVLRVDVPSHDSLCVWLSPIARLLREALGPQAQILLAFDRAGALPEQMADLRDEGFEFVTYERGPYPRLPESAYQDAFVYDGERVRFVDARLKNLGSGRGRVRRIAFRTPDDRQLNLLAISSRPAPELYRILRNRWVQENSFKHTDRRWGINQLDGRQVEPYDPKTIIPNPARRRLDQALRIQRVREGTARRELSCLADGHPDRAHWEAELEAARETQGELQDLRPALPTHAPLEETDLAGILVKHRGEYKALIDAVRIACANAESELACLLSASLPRPAEAKKVILNLLQAPGAIDVGQQTITVRLQPAGTEAEIRAMAELLDECNIWDMVLPADPHRRRLRFRLQS